MKRTDIERMISLADDRYIDEIFQDKITGRRRNIFVTFTAVAAALALAAGGISYFVSTADRERDITIDTPAISMDDNVIVNETTVIAERPVDYSELFKNKYAGEYPLYFNVYAESEFKNESTSAFEMDYAVSILPFKADGYTDKRSQFYVYLDENGDAFGATVYLESEFDENASPKFKCININLGKDGKLSHNFPIEDTVPAKRFGADVYCFDDTAAYTSDAYQSNLKAYFAVGDTEYAVETCNISAAETGEIIDSIIQSGFSANSFDMSKAYGFEHETTNINFDTANSTAPFAGYVPVVDSILYLYQKGVIYDVQRVNGNVSGQYMSVVYTDTTDGGDRIMLEYYTSGYSGKEPFEKTVSLQSSSYEFINTCTENGEYKFTLECGKFMINVTAKCSIEKLWAYINAIKNVRATTGVIAHSSRIEENAGSDEKFDFSPFGTLEEAGKLAPFAGYVPNVKEIGDMKIYTGYGSEVRKGDSDEYGQILNISYQSEVTSGNTYGGNDFKAISVTYTEKKAYNIPEAPVIPIAEAHITDIDKLKTDGIREGGRVCYRFIIDCGTCYITVAADCLPEEMRDYLISFAIEKEFGRQMAMSSGIKLVDTTLKKANKVNTFAGHIPQSESYGSLKLSAVSEGYFDGNISPCLIHMVYVDDFDDPKQMLTAHFYSDYRAVSLEEIKASSVPLSELSAENIKEYRTAVGTSLIIDCGDFEVLIGANAECSQEDIWSFINGIRGVETFDVQEIIPLDTIKELAKKGDDLMWDDFDGYTFTEGGSGLYIRTYTVEEGYSLGIGGGSPYEKPMYIHFGKGDGNYIDLRYDSVDEFLGEKVPLYAVDSENGNLLTIEKVKELAKKGEDLTWSDFEEFSGVDVGSGMYIMVYPVEDTDYRVTVGGSPDRKPMYIHFGKGDGNYIDLRKDSIDEFLS